MTEKPKVNERPKARVRPRTKADANVRKNPLSYPIAGRCSRRVWPSGPWRVLRRELSGFSLVELLISLVIVGIVIIPIYNIFSTGKKSTIQNTEYFVAHNLARDRIEGMRVLPFNRIKGDFDIFSKIYRDAGIEAFADMEVDEVAFNKKFNDIFTEETSRRHPELFEKFSNAYREHFGRAYEVYPAKYEAYSRTTTVEAYGPSTASGHSLKKVVVRVSLIEKKLLLAEVVTLMEGR